MPFQPGQSGNPGGRTKKSWIKDRERMREAKTTWQKLLQIRDDLVLERKEIGRTKEGEPIMADVVPSVRDYLACCKQIMDRAVGMPKQEVEVSGEDGKPFAWNLILQSPVRRNGNGHDEQPADFNFHFGNGKES